MFQLIIIEICVILCTDDLSSVTEIVHFQNYTELQPSILYETKALIKIDGDIATCIDLYTATAEGSDNDLPISYILKNLPDNRFVLVEGPPGIGKTTLCIEIANMWRKKELPSCELLLLMLLRDPNIQKISTLQQFAEYFTQSANETSLLYNYLVNKGSVTIILDGYDELDSKQRNSSFITKLIKGDYLPKARIVVTSRPSASACLHDAVDQRIEIFGFSESSRNQYFSAALQSSPLKLEKLHNHLQQNINIDALCYTPFPMSVLVFLCLHQPEDLPTTATKMYHSFIVDKICEWLKAKNIIAKNKVVGEIQQFPQEVQEALQQLQQLAFRCLVEDKIVFTSEELPNLCKDDFSCYGLLQCVEHHNNAMSYSFAHLSIQEFLAACYVASLEVDQLSPLELFFRKDFFCENAHFSNMWAFYCGLTNREGKCHSVLITPLQPKKHCHMYQSNLQLQPNSVSLPQGSLHSDLQSLSFTMHTLSSHCDFYMDGLPDSKMSVLPCKLWHCVLSTQAASNTKLKEAFDCPCLKCNFLSQEMFNDPMKVLYAFRCFLEAEDKRPSEVLAKLFHDDVVNLKDHKLVIPFQIESLGLFLVNAKCDGLILSNCQIGDSGINLLHRFLCSDAVKKHKISTIDFMENDLTEISLPLIGDIIVHSEPHTLKLGCNEFSNIEGIRDAVTTSSTLKVLNLWGCGITSQGAAVISDMMLSLVELIVSNNHLSDAGAKVLSVGLIKTKSLQVLYINDNNIGPLGTAMIAHALVLNTSVKALNMTNNDIGQDGATEIANTIMKNKVLTELLLYGDRTLDEESAILILEQLYSNNNTITKLGLSQKLASNNSIKSFIENINVRRMRYHEPDVRFGLY